MVCNVTIKETDLETSWNNNKRAQRNNIYTIVMMEICDCIFINNLNANKFRWIPETTKYLFKQEIYNEIHAFINWFI